MRLKFEHFDGRRMVSRSIIDEETGKKVGSIHAHGVGYIGHEIHGGGGIEVSLFDGKYAISVNRYEECWGFVKGVEAVLNHMTSLRVAKGTLGDAAL